MSNNQEGRILISRATADQILAGMGARIYDELVKQDVVSTPEPADVAWQADGELERDEDGIVWSVDVKSGQLSAFVKRDGCVDLYDTHGGNMHACSLDDLIGRLHALKAFAVAQWPDGEGGW